MRHVNIPIFIPHLGCPNQCVFCNQRTISGVTEFDPKGVSRTIDDVLSTLSQDDEVEIAFFGGSFTGIDRDLMIELLEIAHSYITRGAVSSIRCSTRPDYIDADILEILKKYGVKVIELGLQSASDSVLSRSKRGHDRAVAERASRMIVDAGFTLVGQMMIGLPGSDLDSELDTAEFIISVGARAARIYPTVVFRDTELCAMAERGEYEPLQLWDAVNRSAEVLRRFVNAGIEVIRIGLCSSENLSSNTTYHSGPNHSAIGELVENEFYFKIIYAEASAMELSRDDILIIKVSRGSTSKAVGQKRRNKLLLRDMLGIREVRVTEDATLSKYEILLQKEDRRI